MTVIVRKFSASPEKDAVGVWDAITDLVCHDITAPRSEFVAVKGGVCSIISDQIVKDHPIVIRGSGPLLRIYCLYGDDAVLGQDVNEDSINWNPFKSDWKVYIPCPKDELSGLRAFLTKRSSSFEAYDSKEGLSLQKSESRYIGSEIEIDENALRNL